MLHQRFTYALALISMVAKEKVDIAICLHIGKANDSVVIQRDKGLTLKYAHHPGVFIILYRCPGTALLRRIIALINMVHSVIKQLAQQWLFAGLIRTNLVHSSPDTVRCTQYLSYKMSAVLTHKLSLRL